MVSARGEKLEAGKGNWEHQNGKCSSFSFKWDGHVSEDAEVKNASVRLSGGKSREGRGNQLCKGPEV